MVDDGRVDSALADGTWRCVVPAAARAEGRGRDAALTGEGASLKTGSGAGVVAKGTSPAWAPDTSGGDLFPPPAFIAKPFEPARLLNEVSRLIAAGRGFTSAS